jgi:hypothetical protein
LGGKEKGERSRQRYLNSGSKGKIVEERGKKEEKRGIKEADYR